jgi:hypothetical protein
MQTATYFVTGLYNTVAWVPLRATDMESAFIEAESVFPHPSTVQSLLVAERTEDNDLMAIGIRHANMEEWEPVYTDLLSMPPSYQVASVQLPTTIRTDMGVLYAGTYIVEMPVWYDPTMVTGEDLVRNDEMRIISAF